MIVVTGGAGFIGSNVVAALNARGLRDVIVVDDLSDTRKLANVSSASILDYLDLERFRHLVETRSTTLAEVTLVLHQGACSSTTEPDGRYVLDNNYEYSKELISWAVERSTPVIYASSAAVYGASENFAESTDNERPLNVYGWSKLLTDNWVRRALPAVSSQIVGLRYFNVYGPGEAHKDDMASIVTQLDREVRDRGTATIFGASHGLGPGQQRRDFVSVDDVVDVMLWFAEHPEHGGVFNCGTGQSATFESVARAVIEHHGAGELRYRDFPEELRDRYQAETTADLTRLRSVGYTREFTPVAEGIARYLSGDAASGTGGR